MGKRAPNNLEESKTQAKLRINKSGEITAGGRTASGSLGGTHTNDEGQGLMWGKSLRRHHASTLGTPNYLRAGSQDASYSQSRCAFACLIHSRHKAV